MGQTQAPKQFPAPGAIGQMPNLSNILMPAQALPQNPLNPNLFNPNVLPTPDQPTYAAPNATPVPKLPGKNNDLSIRGVIRRPYAGGYGGGFGRTAL